MPTAPQPPEPSPSVQDSTSSPPTLGPEDFYYDGPFLVFTEAYHLRRGTCCQSGCRHCPYGFTKTT